MLKLLKFKTREAKRVERCCVCFKPEPPEDSGECGFFPCHGCCNFMCGEHCISVCIDGEDNERDYCPSCLKKMSDNYELFFKPNKPTK